MPKPDVESEVWVRGNLARIWPVHLAGFTRLLGALRRAVGGDLDLVLILAVIADRTPREAWSQRLSPSGRLTRGNPERVWQEPINVQSIADSCGIQKETVRRKVNELVKRGWIARDRLGYLSVTRQAAQGLKAETEASVSHLADLPSTLME
jgi:hypothetical protein